MNKTIKSSIRVGDKVKIITGNYKGIIGTINAINFKKSVLFINEISPRIKFLKDKRNEESQKIELKIPIHISNVLFWDETNKNTRRIGYKLLDNKKSRFFKSSQSLTK
jgi:large subunit ribosomal protein L24